MAVEHNSLSGNSLHVPKAHKSAHHDGTDNLDQLPFLVADLTVKKSTPATRYVGAVDLQWVEGTDLNLQVNTGSEASPSWTNR